MIGPHGACFLLFVVCCCYLLVVCGVLSVASFRDL